MVVYILKKLMVFTASTGGGHNAVANTLREVFKDGYEVEIVDALKETNKILDTVVSDGYRLLATNTPKLYGELYKIANLKRMNDSVSNTIIYLIRGKLYRKIMEFDPDIIVGTHPFIVDLICSMKKVYGLYIPFISFVTDFQAHQSYVNKDVDAYVVGSEFTKKTLIKKKINPEIIFPFGIPIKTDFYKDEIKCSRDSERFTILLMGGSMGVSGIKSVIKRLVKNRHSLKIIVICGNNEDMKKQLDKKYGDYRTGNIIIEILGFSKDVCKYMEISDIIISKPGGLTVSESIAKQLPLVIPYMIPGQESENKDFLVEAGLAEYVKSISKINDYIDYFIEKPEHLEKIRENMKKLYNTYSLEKVVKLSDQLIEKYRIEHKLHQQRSKSDVLILSARFGMGHKSVSSAMMEQIRSINSDIKIHENDLLEWIVPDFHNEIYKGYELLVNKGTSIYNYFYRHNKKPTRGIDKLFMNSILKDVKEMIEEIEPKVIISTFPLCSKIISLYKEKYDKKLPLITCITDIVDQWEWIHPLTDSYFVATKEIKMGLIEKKVDSSKIFVTGVPVRKEFNYIRKRENKKTRNVLLMGGGFGLLPNEKEFYTNLDCFENIESTVITGSNYELYLKLYGVYSNIEVYAFTDEVPALMKQTDLLVGKAGGVTLFEAIQSELPILVCCPVLEQEKYNARFIEKNNIGKVFWDMPENLSEKINEIVTNDDLLLEMQNNIKEIKKEFDYDAMSNIFSKHILEIEE